MIARLRRFAAPGLLALGLLAACAGPDPELCGPTADAVDGGTVTRTSAGMVPGVPDLKVLPDGVEVAARVSTARFERELLGVGMPGYHFLVYSGGASAGASLFLTPVTDVQVLDTLETLGAKPGDALDLDTWEDRKNPRSPAPDKVIEGPEIEISVLVPGRAEPLALSDILDDPGAKGFLMRFGGHRKNIPSWRSGCVVCLYSCPGSKVGNAAYTLRDWTRETTKFRVKKGALPADGTPVRIQLRWKRPAPSAVARR